MSVSVGDIVNLTRLESGVNEPGRYVVASLTPGPKILGDFARLVRKRADGTYHECRRSVGSLKPIPYEPFTQGEWVRVNSVPETGAFMGQHAGIASVMMIPWAQRVYEACGHDSQFAGLTTRLSFWLLVLENRLQ